MAQLSEWLKIMLGEVTRKGEEHTRAAAEAQARTAEDTARPAASPAPAAAEVR